MSAEAVRTKAGAEIREHRLDNGMRVLLIERHLDPVVAVMIWYGVEPAVASDPRRALKLAAESKISKLRQFIARRTASTR